MIEQAGKPLQVKDKYITNVFKGYLSREAKITANRGGNRTACGKGIKTKFCMNINTLKWYFSIKASCICLVLRVYFMLKRYISFIKLEKESKCFKNKQKTGETI